MNDTLSAKYKVSESNLARRREFVRLGRQEQDLLASLLPWAERTASRLAEEFYDWQFSFGPTREFFESASERRRMSMEALRKHLESSQAGYFLDIFRGATENWGVEYFERRLRVGQLHNVINLPLKWYLGSYTEYNRLIRRHLLRSFWWKPAFALRAEEAIQRVFNYDMQSICDAFFLDFVETTGLDVASIEVTRGADVTEGVGALKDAVRHLVLQAEALAAEKL